MRGLNAGGIIFELTQWPEYRRVLLHLFQLSHQIPHLRIIINMCFSSIPHQLQVPAPLQNVNVSPLLRSVSPTSRHRTPIPYHNRPISSNHLNLDEDILRGSVSAFQHDQRVRKTLSATEDDGGDVIRDLVACTTLQSPRSRQLHDQVHHIHESPLKLEYKFHRGPSSETMLVEFHTCVVVGLRINSAIRNAEEISQARKALVRRRLIDLLLSMLQQVACGEEATEEHWEVVD